VALSVSHDSRLIHDLVNNLEESRSVNDERFIPKYYIAITMRNFLLLATLLLCATLTYSWTLTPTNNNALTTRATRRTARSSFSSSTRLLVSTEEKTTEEKSVEETTEKYGLEAGLFKASKEKDGGETAKSLLKKYGVAYLATSIPLALVSFGLCYLLVDNGVDVGSLLQKVGISPDDNTEKASTFAIAYAAHKAASPIRFPPTVLLTPVVAKILGKEADVQEE
jgi:hypothetical protein